MTKDLKKKIKGWWFRLKNSDDLGSGYLPQIKETRAVIAEVDRISGSVCHAMPWSNGEGYIFDLCDDKGNEKHFSLHDDEIDIILECLNEFNYFDKS